MGKKFASLSIALGLGICSFLSSVPETYAQNRFYYCTGRYRGYGYYGGWCRISGSPGWNRFWSCGGVSFKGPGTMTGQLGRLTIAELVYPTPYNGC
jgi:hypothetical protein